MKKLKALLIASTLGLSLFAGIANFRNNSTPQQAEATRTMDITVNPSDLRNKGNWGNGEYDNTNRTGTTNSGITFSSPKGSLRYDSDAKSWFLYIVGDYSFTVSSSQYTFLKVVFTFDAGSQWSTHNEYWYFIADDNDGANIKMESHRLSATRGYWEEDTPKNSVTAMPSESYIKIKRIVITVVAPVYSVNYDANGGSGETVDPTEYIQNENATVLDSSFAAPEGKAFSHWNTAANGSGTSYNPGAKVKITGNLTLYAQYSNKMIYSANGYSDGYDGEAHKAQVVVTAPSEGAVIKYGTTQGTYDLDDCPEYTEVGEHVVYYRITADNYATETGSFVINVLENDKAQLKSAIEEAETLLGQLQEKDPALAAQLQELLNNAKNIDGNKNVTKGQIEEVLKSLKLKIAEANKVINPSNGLGWMVALIVIVSLLTCCALFLLVLFIFFPRYIVDYSKKQVIRTIYVKKHFNMVLMLDTHLRKVRRNEVDVYKTKEEAEKALNK